MEPITSASIAVVVQYLATRVAGTIFDTSTERLTEGGIRWIKSLLWKNDLPEAALQRLLEKPESEARKQTVAAIISTDLEDNPSNHKWLKELANALQPAPQTTISNSKNVNTGNITAGGSVTIGDK